MGGCLELIDAIGKGAAGWKSVTPFHNRFVDTMRSSRLHIIATMRSVQDYAFQANEKGKIAPEKVGMKSIQREGMDYEFGIIFDINMKHFAQTSKDRTGIFTGKGHFQIDENTGISLLKWSKETKKPGFDPESAMQKNYLFRQLASKGIYEDYYEDICLLMKGKQSTEIDAVIKQYELTLQEKQKEVVQDLEKELDEALQE